MLRIFLIILFILPLLLSAVIHMEAIYPRTFSNALLPGNGILAASTATSFTDQSVNIYNAANPASLQLLSTFNVSAQWEPKIAGTRLYFPSNEKIICYNIANPSDPALAFQYTYNMAGGHYREMAISGDYLYLATQDLGLRVVYIANPTSATEIGHLTDGNPFFWVWVDGNRACVLSYNLSSNTGTLKLIDVTNPLTPIFRGSIALDYSYPDNVSVQFYQDYMYVSIEYGSTKIYDVSNMLNPQEVQDLSEWSFSNQIIKEGIRYCTQNGSFHIQSLENPITPQDIGNFALTSLGQSKFQIDFPYVYFNGNQFGDNFSNRFCLDIGDINNSTSIVSSYNTGVLGNNEIAAFQNFLFYKNTVAELSPSNVVSNAVACPAMIDVGSFHIENDLLHTIDTEEGSNYFNYNIYSLDIPQQPNLLSTTHINPIYDFKTFGNYTFLTNYDSLSVIYTGNPNQIEFLSNFDLNFSTFTADDSCFWSVSNDILYSYHLNQFGQFERQDSLTIFSPSYWYGSGIVKLGDYLYIVGADDMIRIFNISDPMSPSYVTQVNLPMLNEVSSIEPVIYQNRYLIVFGDYSNKIFYYDLINPILPLYLSSSDLTFKPTSIACVNNRLFLINGGILYGLRLPALTGVNDQVTTQSRNVSNYPNPFNPTTTISFNLPIASDVKLVIYNIRGQEVKSLINEHMTSGEHRIQWNGKNEIGHTVSSGVYFTKLETMGKTLTHKMILLK